MKFIINEHEKLFFDKSIWETNFGCSVDILETYYWAVKVISTTTYRYSVFQEILAYKLSSSQRIVRSQTADLINVGSDSNSAKPRHRSGEAEMSNTPRKEVRIPSRRVKSQENLSSSLTSDRDLLPLSSSKDTLMSERKGSLSWDSDSCTHCSLVWQRSFAYPVIGMNRLDIMDDGMEDLIVVTLKGIHILQVP